MATVAIPTRTPKAGPETATGTETARSTAERILDAAVELFAERGITATGMRALAEAAGVSVPTVYNNFASKRELVDAVFASKGLVHDVIERLPPLPPTVAGRLETVAFAELEIARAGREFARLVNRESSNGNPEALEISGEFAQRWIATLRNVIAGASDVRPDLDLDAAAEAVKCAMWGAFQVYLSKDDFDVETSLRAIVTTFALALTR
jgi:AcrR family transcriptional regulator